MSCSAPVVRPSCSSGVVRRHAPAAELREGDLEDDQERHQEEQQQPQVRHRDDQPLARPVLAHVLRPARRAEAEEQLPQRRPGAVSRDPAAVLRGVPGGCRCGRVMSASPRPGWTACQVSYTVSSQRMRSSRTGAAMLGSVTRTISPAVDLHQVDGHVAHVGDLLDHAARPVLALPAGASRWMLDLLRADRRPSTMRLRRRADAVVDVDRRRRARRTGCARGRARPRSAGPRTCSPSR